MTRWPAPTRHVAAACALALVALGCGSLHVWRYPLDAPAPPSAARPAIFFEGASPGGSVRELAMVEAVGTGTQASQEDVLEALLAEAARLGADAIVRAKVDCDGAQCHAWGVAVRRTP